MAVRAETSYTGMDWPLLAVAFVVRIVRGVLQIITLILVAVILFNRFPIARQYVPPLTSAIYEAHAVIMNTLGDAVRQNIPVRLGGRDRTDWVLIVLLIVTSGVVGRVGDGARRRIFQRQMAAKVATLFAETGLKTGSRVTRELEEKVKALKSGGKAERKELLQVFAETKRKLDGMGRDLAFLSIDVVGSTEMKVGEHSAAAEIDFAEYRKLVESVFNAHGLIKAAWTPDGVMACFSHVDTAVQAGQGVIRALHRFNHDVKLMKAPFVVRCGVNSGFIYLDDEMPLEQVSDRVIDIAGHMQKHADPNTVAVPKSIVKPMSNVGGFALTDKVIDGLEVYSWKP
jgi:class 3 adenylate cyclase